MRPRVFPAEDTATVRLRHAGRRCFNEAAGIPRGRPIATRGLSQSAAGFNEAAGIPRGRPAGIRVELGAWRSFNEAAGIPRGRRGTAGS